MNGALPAFCRDCGADARGLTRCRACASPRLAAHAELDALAIAHVDCDAFFAAVEKRDDPSLRDKPLIIGGGKRGVVSTACYIARINGVRSAMPMFQALRLCPGAVVIRPNMAKYAEAGRAIRAMMRDLTPLVEPLSIDEAFLDLSGTEALHRMSPARTLAAFARRVEKEVGVTVSIGLAPNKFLAKIASDQDKPRGFAIIGRADAAGFLEDKPVTIIPGIGKATAAKLARHQVRTLADVRRLSPAGIARIMGSSGERLWRMAHGDDPRTVKPDRERKSVSAETTFDDDVAGKDRLEAALWRLSEKVARQLRTLGIGGTTVTLKLKTPDFRQRTRSVTLAAPTRLARKLYGTGRDLLRLEMKDAPFRLIGIGASELRPIDEADPPDLVDTATARHVGLEGAVDKLRAKFGDAALARGADIKGTRRE